MRAGGPTAGEVAVLVGDATPYVTAAVSAYGGAVLAKVRDDAAGATVGIGRRVLQRVFGHREEGEPLPEPLAALAADPADADAAGMVRWVMRQALEADAMMLEEVRAMLAPAQRAGVKQNVRAGRDAYVAGRDMTINRHPVLARPDRDRQQATGRAERRLGASSLRPLRH